MDVKSRAKPYEIDGGTVWMIPHGTPLLQRFALDIRAAFAPEKPHYAMNVYIMCAPLTVAVDLPPEPAPWLVLIKEFIADKSYFLHPLERGLELEQIAPEGLFEKWFAVYNATRPVELLASPEMQNPSPSPLNEDGTENPTSASTGETF